jgi:mannose-1-phosphate guanylyltransferase
MVHAVIMAGGIGSRFWPQSRQRRPKQFLEVVGNGTLIQNTVARLQGIVPPERCYVVTHDRYVEQTRDQLPAIPEENILAEPISKNTAPCITYATIKLLAKDPDATVIVLPADHVITNVRQFHRVLGVAIETAQEPGSLVTIGIYPTHPETGFGYIQADTPHEVSLEQLRAYPVKTFAEKPDRSTAERFLHSGDFLWNSGMFIWRAESIIEEIRRHLPQAYEAFAPLWETVGTENERQTVEQAFRECPRISIDYGVMERSEKVYVVPGSFGWSDVGDWRAVYELGEKNELGNTVRGNAILHNANRCLVHAGDRLIVVVGIDDAVVVDSEDAVLVCNRDSAQQVKNVVEHLHAWNLEKYI